MDYQLQKIEKYFYENKKPQELLTDINQMDKKTIREIFKKSYLPVTKSKDEIKNSIKYKRSWKFPSSNGKEFNNIQPLKPKLLNFWEQERVNMPERSYERYPVSRAIKNYLPGRDFCYDETGKTTSEQYQIYLKQHKEKFDDFVQRPSKYNKPQRFLPSILNDKKDFTIKKSEFEQFNFDRHNTFIYENQFRMKKK